MVLFQMVEKWNENYSCKVGSVEGQEDEVQRKIKSNRKK